MMLWMKLLQLGVVVAHRSPPVDAGWPQQQDGSVGVARHHRGSGGSSTATRRRSSTTVRHGGATPPHGISVVEE